VKPRRVKPRSRQLTALRQLAARRRSGSAQHRRGLGRIDHAPARDVAAGVGDCGGVGYGAAVLEALAVQSLVPFASEPDDAGLLTAR
jgi:hypothetical protein